MLETPSSPFLLVRLWDFMCSMWVREESHPAEFFQVPRQDNSTALQDSAVAVTNGLPSCPHLGFLLGHSDIPHTLRDGVCGGREEGLLWGLSYNKPPQGGLGSLPALHP